MNTNLVTLHDGRTVPSDSEDFRHECEARAILSLPRHRRADWLDVIGERRGQRERVRMETTMLVLSLPAKASLYMIDQTIRSERI